MLMTIICNAFESSEFALLLLDLRLAPSSEMGFYESLCQI